jgi:DNA polymerase V
MVELDKLNERYGSGAVGFAVAHGHRGKQSGEWVGRKQMLTPAYTTDFGQLWCINMDGPAFGKN